MDTSDRTADQPRYATERDPRLRLIIPIVVAIAFSMEQLDSTIITTAIPAMAKSLDATPLQMNLAVTAYVLTLAVFIPVSGWFADRFGTRRIFALSLVVFTVSSALCGAAQSFEMLVVTRALQGFGGAMMTPVGRLILLRSFPRNQLMTAMAYMTVPSIFGPVIGPVLGGILTTYASWRWIFYVNLPFGILGIVLALRYVEGAVGDVKEKFDFPGFLMFGFGVASLQFGLENLGRPTISAGATAALLTTAVVLFVGYGRYARGREAPAVDLTLFRNRSFWVSVLPGGLCRIALNGAPFLLPLMLQVGFGLSPIESGSLTFLGSAGVLIMRSISTFLLRRLGFGPVLIASAVAGAAGMAGFSLIEPDTPHWIIAVYVVIFGLVRASQFMTSNTLAYADMPADKLSRATSVGGVVQQLSVSFGVSIAAMLLGLIQGQNHALTPTNFHTAFLLMAVLPLLALPGFFRLRSEDGAQVSGYGGKSA